MALLVRKLQLGIKAADLKKWGDSAILGFCRVTPLTRAKSSVPAAAGFSLVGGCCCGACGGEQSCGEQDQEAGAAGPGQDALVGVAQLSPQAQRLPSCLMASEWSCPALLRTALNVWALLAGSLMVAGLV